MKPVSEKPVSYELYSDIEYEKYYTCTIELGYDFLELFMPKNPKHTTREKSYVRTHYTSDKSMKQGDVASDISIDADGKYYEYDNSEDLQSSQEFRVNMFICNTFFVSERFSERIHRNQI